ncbi:hypothetical protein AAVH_31732, partial [Aphelenchoides avenae]
RQCSVRLLWPSVNASTTRTHILSASEFQSRNYGSLVSFATVLLLRYYGLRLNKNYRCGNPKRFQVTYFRMQ